jgi:membrane protein DedA with SNARE-associated domain
VLHTLTDYILHLDAHLTRLVAQWGAWVHLAIGATIFSETGLVVAPWLPGESLLLASGTLAGAACSTSLCWRLCCSSPPSSATSATTSSAVSSAAGC